MFIKHQISILELILKDHVTLKAEIMTAENFALTIEHLKIYSNEKHLHYVFCIK